MDGGGRLARSVRLPRPQTDLKAAALGAAILLREWIVRVMRRRTPPPVARRPAPSSNHPLIVFIERRVPRRAGIFATVAILCGSAMLGVVKGGHMEEVTTGLSDARNAVANAAGFRITGVAINGRKQLSQDEVLAIGGVNGRSSLLFLDAAVVRAKLMANPWIADATVLKFYPGTLQIDVTERSPFALWQEDGKVSVIAEDGAVLEPYVIKKFASLPLVVGKGAESHARDFLALLDRYPQIRPLVRAAVFVGERRWNLRLKNGLDIRLPEHDVGIALATLSKFDKEDKLFTRDIVAVDARLPDRLTVRLSEDAAKARDEMLKEKKPKRKAGDA